MNTGQTHMLTAIEHIVENEKVYKISNTSVFLLAVPYVIFWPQCPCTCAVSTSIYFRWKIELLRLGYTSSKEAFCFALLRSGLMLICISVPNRLCVVLSHPFSSAARSHQLDSMRVNFSIQWDILLCISICHAQMYVQESPAIADKPARRLRKVCTVYVRAVGL